MDINKYLRADLEFNLQLYRLDDAARDELEMEYRYCNPNDFEEVRALYDHSGVKYTRTNWHISNDRYRTAFIKDSPVRRDEYLLSEAIILSTKAHAGQVDKAGEPYILHPVRVMLGTTILKEQVVAILHDVIEDTTYGLEEVRELGLSAEQMAALELLTHDPVIPYAAYIESIGTNRLARNIKLLDLADNMGMHRTANRENPHVGRLLKYANAITYLSNLE